MDSAVCEKTSLLHVKPDFCSKSSMKGMLIFFFLFWRNYKASAAVLFGPKGKPRG